MGGTAGMSGTAGMGGTAGMRGMAGMGGMARSDLLGGDAGDVTYPYYLANGRTAKAPTSLRAEPGQRIRLRMINMGGDTAFRVGVPGSPLTITHTDGFPVTPTKTDAVLLGMGKRVDAVVTMPRTAMPLVGIAEGKNAVAQVVLQPGRGPAPDAVAALAALMARPARSAAGADRGAGVAMVEASGSGRRDFRHRE